MIDEFSQFCREGSQLACAGFPFGKAEVCIRSFDAKFYLTPKCSSMQMRAGFVNDRLSLRAAGQLGQLFTLSDNV